MPPPTRPQSHVHLCGWRTVAAFAILPPLDALLGYVLFPLMWWLREPGRYAAMRGEADLQFAFISGVAGLLVTIGGAVPLAMSLAQRRRLSLRNAAISGVLLGNAPFAVYVAFLGMMTVTHLIAGTLRDRLLPISGLIVTSAWLVAIGSTMGLISALVFWWIGVCDGKE